MAFEVRPRSNISHGGKTEKIIYCLKVHTSNDFEEFPPAYTEYKTSLSLIVGTYRALLPSRSLRRRQAERGEGQLVFSFSQVDLAGKHGDHQDDGEAGEQPRILDQEEDDLGGHSLLPLCDGVHLRKLRGGGARPDV